MSDSTDSESPARLKSVGVAALALDIPHEVRLKLAKRMRAEQLRRFEEREKKQQLRTGNSSQNRPEFPGETVRRKNVRPVVAFQAKDILMDAAQNGDTDEGIEAPWMTILNNNAQSTSLIFVAMFVS